ncbi:hypothetical protein J7I98_22195 [Streptomyces sp. ISL-98]|uniref:hypothetical protein n=1 Tax=Streptomyces sp. ISL-98 TaxID=2819192 RepID=UPI001BE8FF3F|nr:hypothetical protein [Streptomyces sp. ISL-98]MBT2508549.1 hypothetical protein [Streptomyces sp. ISL-98]
MGRIDIDRDALEQLLPGGQDSYQAFNELATTHRGRSTRESLPALRQAGFVTKGGSRFDVTVGVTC